MVVVKADSKGREHFCRPLRLCEKLFLALPASELCRSRFLFSLACVVTRFGAGVPAEAESELVLGASLI